MDHTTLFGQLLSAQFDARHVTVALQMMLWAVALVFSATRMRRTQIDD